MSRGTESLKDPMYNSRDEDSPSIAAQNQRVAYCDSIYALLTSVHPLAPSPQRLSLIPSKQEPRRKGLSILGQNPEEY